jgi:DNA processing protein
MIEREALAVLVGVDRLGPATLGRLLAAVGGPVRLVELAAAAGGGESLRTLARSAPGLRLDGSIVDGIVRAVADAPASLERLRAAALSLVALADAAYPTRLRQIELPPHVLFVSGDVRALSAPRAVAIVGTRRPTDAGRRLAARISGVLARNGAAVVSGLAVGIDGAAHAACLAEGGTTVAILGGGHGALYPRSHRKLADAIATAGGAVISEFPPEVAPRPGTFPRRNRLISGLSDATIVVEAGARSGALSTAAWALEQGRSCFLVPGSLDAPMSAGCLGFLREFPGEARIVAGIPQLIEDLGFEPSQPGAGSGSRTSGSRRPGPTLRPPAADAVIASLGTTEGRVAGALGAGLATVDELVAATNFPVAAVLAALSMLESRGLVVGAYGRYRPAGALGSSP